MEYMNCIIVHGSPNKDRTNEPDYVPDSKKGWLLWIKGKIEEGGIKCEVPQMPTPWHPKYSEWKKVIEKLKINEDTILIGHSAGGAFLVRYLDENKKKIYKLILVSPGKAGKESRETLSDLYGKKSHEQIKKYVKEQIIIFTSEEDHSYHIESAYDYGKEFNAKVIKLGKGFGHFTTSGMKTEKFPELLEEVLK